MIESSRWGGRSLGVRLGSNVNFFQMKTRQHPYWLRALCEAGKPTLTTLIQGNGLMLIRLGSWTQGKPVCEHFSKLIFSFKSFEGSQFTRLCQYACNPTEASKCIQSSVAWNWRGFRNCAGLAAVCPPSCLPGNFVNFVGLTYWRCKCWLLSLRSPTASLPWLCSHRDAVLLKDPWRGRSPGVH